MDMTEREPIVVRSRRGGKTSEMWRSAQESLDRGEHVHVQVDSTEKCYGGDPFCPLPRVRRPATRADYS